MKTIGLIFRRDLGRICKNAMALIVAAGIAVLPALYAWFNIAANWDPYGSTSGIQVAVASEDDGAELEGVRVNIGDKIITSLKANDQIGWRFTDRAQAVAGVERGDYYACIVIPADFSERMVSILSDDIRKPEIDYYINEKKNAIAPKITDKGVSAVQQQVNSTFTSIATEAVVSALEGAAGGLEERGSGVMDTLMDRLRQADASLERVERSIDIVCAAAGAVDELTAGSKALLPSSQGALDGAGETVGGLRSLLSVSRQAAGEAAGSVGEMIDAALDGANAAGDEAVELLRRAEGMEPGTAALSASLARLQRELGDGVDSLDGVLERLEELEYGGDADRGIAALEDARSALATLKGLVDETAAGAGDLAGLLGEGSPMRQKLLDAGEQARALSRDTLGPLLEEAEADLAANPPPADPADYTRADRLRVEKAAALAAAKAGADLAGETLSAENLDKIASGDAGLQARLRELSGEITAARADLGRMEELLRRIPGDTGLLLDSLEHLDGALGAVGDLVGEAGDLLDQAQPLPDGMAARVSALMDTVNADTDAARAAARQVQPALDRAVDQAYGTLDSLSGLLDLFSGTLPQMGRVLDHMDGAVASASDALRATKALVADTRGDLRELLGRLESAGEDGRVQALTDFLQNSSSDMGSFMAAPVEVNTHSLYPIRNYGSAMAAFYSTLAIWVGGVVLVAILKVKVDEDGAIRNLKPWQAYLGRYLLFLLFGLIQSTIICLGDLYVLGIQCTSKPLFLLSGWACSLVFTLIIYTLTVSFGDVGKALAVILLVIQIAGSGGTFPIEVTPQFFQNVYPFLPFTHGINAMRETIAGQYGLAYWADLLKLGAFLPAALFLGLVLRKPLIRMNAFFEARLENTGLM